MLEKYYRLMKIKDRNVTYSLHDRFRRNSKDASFHFCLLTQIEDLSGYDRRSRPEK